MNRFPTLLAQDNLDILKANHAPGALSGREMALLVGAFAAAILISVISVIVLVEKGKLRKNKPSGDGRRRKRTHRRNNPTLAETGGLPPRREGQNPPTPPS